MTSGLEKEQSTGAERSGRTWRRRGVIVAFIGVAWLGCFIAARSSRDGQRAKLPFVAETALDFGEVWEDRTFVWKLPVENRGEEAIEIQSFLISCTCLSVQPNALTIPAGETSEVVLTLDLRDRQTVKSGTEGRSFEVSLVPLVKGQPAGTTKWQVHGRVRNLLNVDPEFVRLETAPIGKAGKPFQCEVTSSTLLKQFAASCDPSFGSVTVAPPQKVSAAGPVRYNVTLAPRQRDAPGQYQFDLTLVAVTGSGVKQEKKVRIEESVAAKVRAVPAEIAFGAVQVGEGAAESVVLQDETGEAFDVERISIVPKDSVTIVPLPVLHGSRRAFRVATTVRKPEDQKAQVVFEVRSSSATLHRVHLDVRWRGYAE